MHEKTLPQLLALLLLGLLFSPIPCTVVYADGPGANTARVLKMSQGARVPALGSAQVATASNVDALNYNPAGLAYSDYGQSELMYHSLVAGIEQGSGSVSRPITGMTGGWGASVQYVDYGQADRTTLNTGGSLSANNQGQFSGTDIVARTGFGLPLTKRWSWGLNLKAFRLKIAEVTASGIALDGGVQWRSVEYPLALGFSLRNLGADVTFQEADEALPLEYRFGGSYAFFDGDLRLYADFTEIRNGDFGSMGGVEYRFRNWLYLRGGYDGSNDTDDGLTAGLGVRYNNTTIDYAYVPYGVFGNQQRLSFTYNFGVQP